MWNQWLDSNLPYLSWVDAKDFDEHARNAEYTVNSIPEVGSIAQHNYGHVAVVEKVYQDNIVVISESSYDPCSLKWNFLHRVRVLNTNDFDNYIHVEVQ